MVGLDGAVTEVVKARDGAVWTDDAVTVARLLSQARGHRTGLASSGAAVQAALKKFAGVVRTALTGVHGVAAATGRPTPTVRRMIRRLRRLAAHAVRARDAGRLEILERGFGFLRRGHSAGESALVEDWLEIPEPQLLNALGRLPLPRREGVERVELLGLLLVERVCRTR
jgi:hypothetical protein